MADIKRKKNSVNVRGAWLPMSLDFLRSRACAELSGLATKLMIDFCSQLGWNGKGNGDLTAAPAVLGARGWTSNASRLAALAELEAKGLLVITRHGNRRLCSLYAVTLWPMDCNFAKLDHGPGCYTTALWEQEQPENRGPPTAAAPAVWATPRRKNAKSGPAKGQPPTPNDKVMARHGTTPPQETADLGPPRANNPGFRESRSSRHGAPSKNNHLHRTAIKPTTTAPSMLTEEPTT
jgi:hypothetical protein